MTKQRRGKKKGTLEWQLKTMMVMRRRTFWGPTAIMINPSPSLTTFLQNWNLVPGAPHGLKKGSSIQRRLECPDGSSVAAAFAVDFEVEGVMEQHGETRPLTELVLAECNFRGSHTSPERMKTVYRKKTTNCCTNVGKWFILFTVSAQATELHVLLLIFWTYFGPATVSWSILWKRECVQGYLLQGVFFFCLFLVYFFKCRLTYMVLLSGSLKGCYSLSLNSDSFSEPWRR